MTLRLVVLVALCVTSLIGCGEKATESCFVGDEDLPVEIVPVFRTTEGEIEVIEAGGEVPLITPPQGGKVMFIGVRARNVDGCPLRIDTALRDICTPDVVSLERRPIRLTLAEDGWLEPLFPMSISNYSNLPACPRAGLDRDVHGEHYTLSIRVTDSQERTAETNIDIVPTCAEPEHYGRCRCECRGDYELGQICEDTDAGVPLDASADSNDGSVVDTGDADGAQTDAPASSDGCPGSSGD